MNENKLNYSAILFTVIGVVLLLGGIFTKISNEFSQAGIWVGLFGFGLLLVGELIRSKIRANNPLQQNQVIVVDVKMPFFSMVGFMVKWAIAAIPAIIILIVFFSFAMGMLASIGLSL